MAKQKLQIPDLSLGLATKQRPAQIPPGSCQDGSKNFWLYGNRLGTPPGTTRITRTLPDDHAYRFNGVSHYIRGRNRATGSLVNLGTSAWSIQVVLRLDSMALSGSESRATFLYKGLGESTPAANTIGNLCYEFCVRSNNGAPTVRFSMGSATAVTNADDGSSISYGIFYVITITKSGSTLTVYSTPVGQAATAGATTPITVGSTTPQDVVSDLIVGAKTKLTPARKTQLVQSRFKGVIQEIRYWDKALSTSDIDQYSGTQITDPASETNLVAYYRLTGLGDETYFFETAKGTSGSGASEAPILALEPRDLTRVVSGSPIGTPISTGSFHFDGKGHGFDILDSYQYRRVSADDDGSLGLPDVFQVSFRFKPTALADNTMLWQWAAAPSASFVAADPDAVDLISPGDYTIATTATIAHVQIIEDTGSFFFAATYNTIRSGTYKATTVISSVALSAGGTYAVSAWFYMGSGGKNVRIKVNNTSDIDGAVIVGDDDDIVTPDTPPGTARKYWMTVGRCLSQVRQMPNTGDDPNGIDVEYDFSRSADGVMQQLVLTQPSDEDAAFVTSNYFDNNIVDHIDVRRIEAPVFSVFPMSDVANDTVLDLGSLGNAQDVAIDPDYVWGKSGITTIVRAPIVGVFDHRYVDYGAASATRLRVAIAAGSAYSVNPSTGALTWMDDGFRNDDGNIVSTAQFRDGVILCCGGRGGNFKMFKGHLYRLSIEAPEGVIPYGLSSQTNEEAALTEGERLYTFTFYSRFQDQRSAAGPILSVSIKAEKANVTFGTGAEINQTYPTTGDSDNKQNYDFETGLTAPVKLNVSGWYGRENAAVTGDQDFYQYKSGSGVTSNGGEAPVAHVRCDQGSVTDDVSDITGNELKNIIEAKAARVFCEVRANGKFRINGAFPGGYSSGGSTLGGFLWIKDTVSSKKVSQNAGVVDWNIASGGAAFSGTGITGHGLGLPVPRDTQVTDLEIWRTVAGGSVFQLVARVPAGVTDFVDTVPDEDLVGETLDISAAPAPSCQFVTDFGGRMIFYGDSENPQRVYFSEVARPYSVPAENVIDFLDGDTLGINAAARTENTLTLMKERTLFVISQSNSPDIPFSVETRMQDIGCSSPFGVVNVNESFFFPAEQGFYFYDTNTLTEVGDVIDPTWDAIPAENRNLVFGIHDRIHKCILWFCPSGSSTVSGDVVNDQVLVYFYGTSGPDGKKYGWSKLTGLYVRAAAIIPDDDETSRVWLIDPMGYLSVWDEGTNYGPGSLTSRTPAGAAGTFNTTTVTVAQATLANLTDGYKGLPITVVDATDGTRETRLCIADTLASPSVLTLDHALSFTPVAGDTYLIGSIETDWISGEASPFGYDREFQVSDVYLRNTVQSGSAKTISFKWIIKGGVANVMAEQEQTFTNQEQDKLMAMRGRGRWLRMRLQSLAPDAPFEVMFITLVIEEMARGEYQ